MVSDLVFEKLVNIEPENTHRNVLMSGVTTFKIGGAADVFIESQSEDALSNIIKLCKSENIPFTLIGAGSNLLVSDNGIEGVVCRLGSGFDYINIDDKKITAGASVSLAKLAKAAQRASLSGLEFASGIPGSLGGAVFMNAGAYGGEMKDIIKKTRYMDENGDIYEVMGDAHDFSYRHSVFSGGKKYILSSEMELTSKNSDEVLETMKDLNARRKEKQPLEKPSAGSAFKRPEGYFAAKLIEDAGLKGASVGGAEVSEKHAGFIVSDGTATAKDVCDLICLVQKTVYEKFNVELEPEIKITGRE